MNGDFDEEDIQKAILLSLETNNSILNKSVVDSSLELTNANPNIYKLFKEFNNKYFYSALGSVEVKWSKKMTLYIFKHKIYL